jgi:hypothetical protein
LREDTGWDATPYQWATAGYMGAINSGKTICGVLFGASIYLGFLNGIGATTAPELKDEGRLKAIKSVNELFNGFIDRFAETDCNALTGCDWSKKEDIKRYFKDEIYKDICFRQFEYVIEKCINEKAMANQYLVRKNLKGIPCGR